jgi:leucyl-tRNA synthetase
VTPEKHEILEAYIRRAETLGEAARSDTAREKTGCFTGVFVRNPASGQHLPVWVADYVLHGYGTGAIMSVPGHDARDHEFARTFKLPVVQVVDASDGMGVTNAAYEGGGVMVNSGFLDGMTVAEAQHTIMRWLEQNGAGTAKVTYCLRDWLFSRQRYWGEPIPVLHLTDGSIVPLPEDSLPLLPPELHDYKPTESGEPPLARAADWVRTVVPGTDIPAMRETNTMPQWAGSCWYYLRFLDPLNNQALVDPEAERYWMPVDIYIGGAEHAVLHLLYARFWHKVLYDIGIVSTTEPFLKLFNQGMILAPSYRDRNGRYHEPDQVTEQNGRYCADGVEVQRQVEKMSKSRFNVVNPDDVVEQYGADSMRLYEMFMGPLDAAKPWQTAGVIGVRRFLDRTWRIICDEKDSLQPAIQDVSAPNDLLRLRHKTVAAISRDIEALSFNTAIARLMELANALTVATIRPREIVETFVLLLAPFAPHIAEELWSKLGHRCTLAYAPWPSLDHTLAQDEVQEYVVQVNGKVRHRFRALAGLDATALTETAKADPHVVSLLQGKTTLKEIAIPGRLVNFVVRDWRSR